MIGTFQIHPAFGATKQHTLQKDQEGLLETL
ncbi:hypothetical protein BH20BAC1_BH20BAC1_08170 [soil metagenome]